MKNWIPAFQLLGIGFYVAACIAGGILAGWWLGGHNTVWLIVGLVIGLVLAVYGVYKMIKPLMDRYKNGKQDKENS
jgi:membrane protein implicated in regulation of membrane protease activity